MYTVQSLSTQRGMAQRFFFIFFEKKYQISLSDKGHKKCIISLVEYFVEYNKHLKSEDQNVYTVECYICDRLLDKLYSFHITYGTK